MGKLDVMLVQPTTGNDGDPVESSDAGLREEAGEEVSNDTANSVRSEDLNPSEQQESLGGKKRVHRGHHHNQGGILTGWRNCKQFHQEIRRQPQRLPDEWLE